LDVQKPGDLRWELRINGTEFSFGSEWFGTERFIAVSVEPVKPNGEKARSFQSVLTPEELTRTVSQAIYDSAIVGSLPNRLKKGDFRWTLRLGGAPFCSWYAGTEFYLGHADCMVVVSLGLVDHCGHTGRYIQGTLLGLELLTAFNQVMFDTLMNWRNWPRWPGLHKEEGSS
jgi:hypothetical protein